LFTKDFFLEEGGQKVFMGRRTKKNVLGTAPAIPSFLKMNENIFLDDLQLPRNFSLDFTDFLMRTTAFATFFISFKFVAISEFSSKSH
jgi:hypothetical protein